MYRASCLHLPLRHLSPRARLPRVLVHLRALLHGRLPVSRRALAIVLVPDEVTPDCCRRSECHVEADGRAVLENDDAVGADGQVRAVVALKVSLRLAAGHEVGDDGRVQQRLRALIVLEVAPLGLATHGEAESPRVHRAKPAQFGL